MMRGISAQTTWKAYDVGGDGTVSQAEFIGVVKQLLSDDSGEDGGPVPPHGQSGHAHRQWYSNVGKDRHGRVLRVSEADLRGVFDRMDTDGDGQLDQVPSVTALAFSISDLDLTVIYSWTRCHVVPSSRTHFCCRRS